MIRFGSTLTINGIVVYVASNFEKVLLGRYWGADAIGIYGRAYQLIRIPTDTLTGSVGEVAFSALSRLQNDPPRLRSYFLKGYSLVLALTLPATIACAVLAPELISVLLGPKWKEAAPIFRYLTPTILVFAIANPVSWLVMSIGWVMRGFKMSLVIAPVMIASYFVALPYGPKGVALAYSTVMLLWLVPVTLWSVHRHCGFLQRCREHRKPSADCEPRGRSGRLWRLFGIRSRWTPCSQAYYWWPHPNGYIPGYDPLCDGPKILLY